jgi:hypothetical protein
LGYALNRRRIIRLREAMPKNCSTSTGRHSVERTKHGFLAPDLANVNLGTRQHPTADLLLRINIDEYRVRDSALRHADEQACLIGGEAHRCDEAEMRAQQV